MRVTLSLSEPAARTSVERAIAEMRMARPVLLDDGPSGAVIVQGLEDLTPEHAAELDAVIGGGARLVLPAARLKRLGRSGRRAAEATLGARAITSRELEVARLVSEGLANKAIAARLHLSVRTVEVHVRNALAKLALQNRTQLATWARERAD